MWARAREVTIERMRGGVGREKTLAELRQDKGGHAKGCLVTHTKHR